MGQRILITFWHDDTIKEAQLLYNFLHRYETNLLHFDEEGTILGEEFDEESVEMLRSQIDTVLVLIGANWEDRVSTVFCASKTDRALEEIDLALIFKLKVIPLLFYRDTAPDFEDVYFIHRPRINQYLVESNAFKINRKSLYVDLKRLAEECLGLKPKGGVAFDEKYRDYYAQLSKQEQVQRLEEKTFLDLVINSRMKN